MKRVLGFALVLFGMAIMYTPVSAGDFNRDHVHRTGAKGHSYRQPRRYRRGRVAKRRGFYSYTYRDTLPTYHNPPTQGAPFDSGFFFDSAIRPNGGNAPYMN
jgi:hypothetical protein